jgi:hypothetical protein
VIAVALVRKDPYGRSTVRYRPAADSPPLSGIMIDITARVATFRRYHQLRIAVWRLRHTTVALLLISILFLAANLAYAI